MTGELPLRLVDQPGGVILRCLCGAEASTLRKGTTGLRGMRANAPLPQLGPDITPAGILMMIVHAKRCGSRVIQPWNRGVDRT